MRPKDVTSAAIAKFNLQSRYCNLRFFLQNWGYPFILAGSGKACNL